LCREADRDLLRRKEAGETNATIDRVLASWDEDRLEPVVTLEDLLSAAREVVPSVSAAELEKYERLGQQYRKSS
jgi:SpoVK/Ycf46/Vps4 family AAA+-type ATPase